MGGDDELAAEIERVLEEDTVRPDYLATGFDAMKPWLEACVTRW